MFVLNNLISQIYEVYSSNDIWKYTWDLKERLGDILEDFKYHRDTESKYYYNMVKGVHNRIDEVSFTDLMSLLTMLPSDLMTKEIETYKQQVENINFELSQDIVKLLKGEI